MLDLDQLTPEQRHVVDVYRDVMDRISDLCFGDAMTAIGLAANRTMQAVPPEDRMEIARTWADVFVRQVFAAIEVNDA